MELYPFLIRPFTAEKLWGGRRIADELHPFLSTGESNIKIGESLELCVRHGTVSSVRNGEFAGQTLLSLEEKFPDEVLGREYSKPESFPLLVKFIDAAKDLSIQVHPDDAYALENECEGGKSELWYIIDAKEDSSIFLGLADGCAAEDLFSTDDPMGALRKIKVRAGEAYFIPSGTPHAIGQGILLAEIQQNSDLTYRIFDYGRLDANGKARELHVGRARDVIKKTDCGRIFPDADGVLVRFCGICVRVVDLDGNRDFSECSFCSLLCLDGAATIMYGGKGYKISNGDSYFLPKSLKNFKMKGQARILVSTPDM